MRAFLTSVLAVAACVTVATAQDLQTRSLILRSGAGGSITTTISGPTSGGPYNFTIPSGAVAGVFALNATPLLGSRVMLYGVTGAQNLLDVPTSSLFNVSYDGVTTGSTAGAVILSNATAPAATSTGLTVSATGATANYALIVPASGGNVGIGNSTPTSLLSVGSSGQFTVDASGNVTTTGTSSTGQHTITGGAALRINRTDNTVYNAITTDAAQAGNITYTMPTATGTAGQVLSIKASPAPTATSATLEWKTASGGGGSYTSAAIAGDQAINGTCAGLTGMTFTPTAGSVYAIRITIIATTAAAGTTPDVKLCKDFIDAACLWQVGYVNGAGAGQASTNDDTDETLYTNMPLSTTKTFVLSGLLTAGSNTPIQLQMKITGGTAVTTIKVGSMLEYKAL